MHQPAGRHPCPAAATTTASLVVCTAVFLLAAQAAVAAGGPAGPGDVVLFPDRDTTLFQDHPDNGNGGSSSMIVGRIKRGPERRSLVHFDLAPVAAALDATPGLLIQAARLELQTVKTPSGAPTSNDNVALHRVLMHWTEDVGLKDSSGRGELAAPGSTSATWISRKTKRKWAIQGGQFAPAPSAEGSATPGQATLVLSGAGLVADLDLWLSTREPGDNRGWIVKSASLLSGTALHYGSSNGPTAQQPKLIITLATGPTGACCSSTCTVVTSGRCGFGGFYLGDGTVCLARACELTELEPFVDALPIPAVATPIKGRPNAEATYHMTVEEAAHSFHRDLQPATVWGFNGQYPGPTIAARKGKTVTVVWRNELSDWQVRTNCALAARATMPPPFVPHLHGGVVSPRFDGNPDFPISPKEEGAYVYPNKQPAATLWYHDSARGRARLSVYMGLAGAWLVRSPAEDRLGLPAGELDVPLILQDRSFNPDGTLLHEESFAAGVRSRFIVVNGKVAPFLDVKRTKYRFRMINACNARTLTLRLTGGRRMEVIATDRGLLAAPVRLRDLTLAPGERYEALIDFSDVSASKLNLINVGGGSAKRVLRFSPKGASLSPPATPQSLARVKPLKERWARTTRTLTLTQTPEPKSLGLYPCTSYRWKVDGRGWEDVTELPVLGDVEIWEFRNPAPVPHAMHLRLVSLQILSHHELEVSEATGQVLSTGKGTPPAPEDGGWKDTVRVPPRTMVRVITRFKGYTGRFAYHSSVLDHHDNDVLRQFRVVNPGKRCNNDGVCGAREDCVSCPGDCGTSPGAACGNGLCEAADGESCASCPADCSGHPTELAYCCGRNGTCADCSWLDSCSMLPAARACCGDSLCEGGETKASCAVDCRAPPA